MVNHYPPPNNPEVCKVSLIFQRDQREAVNTFHVARTVGWTLPNMIDLANAVKTWYDLVYKLAIPTGVSLANIQVRLLDPLNPLAFDAPVSPVSPGTRAGTMEAANVTAAMSERTGKAGRAYRGRMYVPGLVESDVGATDLLSSSIVTLLYNALANLSFGSLPVGDLLAVFHRPGLTPKPNDNKYDIVQTAVQENIVDSQRKRLPGRGR